MTPERGSGLISVTHFLPRRLRGAPDLIGDLIVAFAAVGMAIVARVLTNMFAPDLVPYVFAFPAVIFAGQIAGVRAGLIAIGLCQMLIWYFVIPPTKDFSIGLDDGLALAVATLSLALTVWAVSSFRATSLRLQEEKEKRVQLLSLALREVDHRTKNNFQIAASLLLSHAGRHEDPRVRQELQLAAGRLQSLASVNARLALSSSNISTVLLHDHLRELCDRITDGMLPAGVSLRLEAEPVEVPAQRAVAIALIVNECLANAAKHAFPDGVGDLLVSLRHEANVLVVSVEDDGVGRDAAKCAGTGSNLTELLTRSINGKFTVDRTQHGGQGTRCELRVPGLPVPEKS